MATLVVVVSLAAAGAAPLGAAGSSRALGSCRAKIATHNWRAVFGHDATLIASIQRVKKLTAGRFKTAKTENRGCNDYAAVLESPEFSKYKVRSDFALEVGKLGYVVSYAAPGDLRPTRGSVNVVFGHRRTLADAAALLVKVARSGWRDTDIAYGGPGDWKVVWPNVPSSAGEQTVPTAVKTGFDVELEINT